MDTSFDRYTERNKRDSVIEHTIRKLMDFMSLSAGYRVDDLDWSIAGDLNGLNPTILSELTWSDLRTFQIQLKGQGTYEQVYWRSLYSYGWVISGDNQDSDFSGNNRSLEFSRSNNDAGAGTVSDASIGLGYQFNLLSGKLTLAPLGGYSRHWQNLRIQEGVQTLGGTLGSFADLDSTYEATWDGLWAGFDLSYQPTKKLTLTGTMEYHWADYEAQADWNLRSDFQHPKSFEHLAEGTGIVASIGGAYGLTDRWLLNANVDVQHWSTDPGIDRTFFASGTTTDTRLNEVNWDSYAVMAGAAYLW